MPDRDIRRPGWKKYLPRTTRQIGRRGVMLLTFGVLWTVIGAGALSSSGSISPSLIHEYLPAWLRASLWIACGLLAIAYAFRPPGLSDRVGFAALYIMPAVRVLSYTLAWIDYLVPIGGEGYELGWRFAAIYASMLATVVITSGWPEPVRTPRPHELDEEVV